MKYRYLVTGLLMILASVGAKSQVLPMYYQGFETTEAVNYSVTPQEGVTMDNTLYASGNTSIKLIQSSSSSVTMITDTIDFTWNTTLRYITLEFDHICTARPNSGTPTAKIYAKRAYQTDNQWQELTAQYYNTSGSHSAGYSQLSGFYRMSYDEWLNDAVTNDCWKSERFDLDNFLPASVAPTERKLIIKFVLNTTTASTNGAAWWIDNLRVRSSQNQIIKPIITMRVYPDGGVLPSSRGARITLEAATSVTQGICADSVYVTYTIGSDHTTMHRVYMTPEPHVSPALGASTYYTARIPFEGYDTTMRFYCTVKDNTTNFNVATFPDVANSWVEYRCVRGTAQPGLLKPGFAYTSSVNAFPFPQFADAKSEWVYDSTLMAEAGYGPGGIVAMRFTVTANNSLQNRPKFQVRLKNVPTNYTVNYVEQEGDFTSDYMHIVYDSAYRIDEVGVGVERTITFQDTFFYAGKDMVVQMIYNGTQDMGATTIGTIPAPSDKKSLVFFGGTASYGYNPYTSNAFNTSTIVNDKRPAMVMTEVGNQPLMYDLGINKVVFPNETNPMIIQPSYIDVQLKNFGEGTVHGVRISYAIDDTIPGYYDWTGSLDGGDSVTVRVADPVSLSAGYHFVRAWVEDTLAIASGIDTMHLRDHEPYNDTTLSEFIVCEGPMHGVRHIGGENGDYNNINEFLFSLNQCGVDDSLVVKIAGGVYTPFVVPEIDGISAAHYVVMEPEEGQTVTIVSDGVATVLGDMTSSGYFRLRNLNFVRTSGPLSNMVLLGAASTGVMIENCTFTDSLENPTSSLRIESLLNTGFANNVIIRGCTFTGGGVGVDISGQASDIRSSNNTMTRCVFYNQYSSAVTVGNQDNITVEKNEMYDVLSNSSYVLRILHCGGAVRILSNKIYTSHGAQALGVSNVSGTQQLHALIANNMVVCADDGTANQQNTPFNIITANWLDIVFNSVKMTAGTRNNVATATFGGANIQNSRFMNNIVACFDDANYAFNYMPGTQTTNVVGHNVYYSEGHVLNRRTGSSYTSLAAWQQAVEMDSTSVSLNPGFLNGSLVDLRTFNRLVKGVGTPIAAVPTDMFDTVRNAVAPCAGAFEFVSLFYDFEVESLVSPEPDNCYLPDNVNLVAVVRNNGVNSYVPGGSVTLGLGYSVNGSTPQTLTVPVTVASESTAVVTTGSALQMPSHGIYDSVYYVKIWTYSPSDPNQTNDTSVFPVISRYHTSAPTNVIDSIPYNTADTAVVSQGILQWSLYNAPNTPTLPSTIYWYTSPDDTEPFHCGTSFITNVLRHDTNFYVRQRRQVPVVRITQVQLFREDTVVGVTSPMPEWIHANTKVVVQLTNIGDDTAFIENDSLLFVSPTNTYNNKFFKFPAGTTIAPGASLAVQFTTSSMANQLPYMIRANVNYTPLPTTDFGLVYRDNGVKDAVAFNNVTTVNSTAAVRWNNLNIPSYVWSGGGVQIQPLVVVDTTVIDDSTFVENTTTTVYAGVVRVGFNGDATDWRLATEEQPMFLGSRDPMWIRYSSNNCEGAVGVVSIRMIAPPSADIELEPMPLPSGCGLGNEPISVRAYNFGINDANNVQLNYSVAGTTVSETLTAPIMAQSDTVYTFLQTTNMDVADDSLFDFTFWVTYIPGDPLTENDTCRASIVAVHTPEMPSYVDTVTIDYATSDTLTLPASGESIPVWYNYNGVPIDTGETHITGILYSEGNMSVAYMAKKDSLLHIGTLANLIVKNAYPSPYQPNNKSAKQQYIYTAHELRSMGMKAGLVKAVAFHLDSIHKVNNTTQRDSVVFNNYDIYLGLTPDTIFSTTSAWKNTSLVYSRTNYPIYRTSSHDWILHVFDSAFVWDGQQSIVVQIVTEISTAITTGVQTAYTAKPNTTLVKNQNTAVGAAYTGAGTKGNNRPDIMFRGRVDGCAGPAKSFFIALDGVPGKDASVVLPDGADTIVYNSCGNVDLIVNMRNMGRDTIEGYQLIYNLDNGPADTTTINHTVVAGAFDTVALFSLPLMPGRHHVEAVIAVTDDSISSNDTIRTSFNVRFCGGDYYIGHDSTSEYSTFGEAIDSMGVVGIDGPVVFHVAGGIYNEQVVLNNVPGSSAQNTITFQGSADSTSTLVGVNTNQANYVVKIDGLSNVIFDSMFFLSRPASGNNAHVMSIQNTSNVTVQNSTLRVKGTVNNTNGSCVFLNSNVNKLKLLDNVLDSGYYSIVTANNSTGYRDFTLSSNLMTNFNTGGVNIIGLTGITFARNELRSNTKSKITGLRLENVDSAITIEKNKIYLIGAITGTNAVIDNFGKRGIELKNVAGSNQMWASITNNMIGLRSNGTNGQDPCGMYIDGTSAYINIYFNTVQIYAGIADVTKTKAFFSAAATNHMQVLNNIFCNNSNSYAYYVNSSANVTSSDYNAYYTAGEKLAFWGNADRPTLTDLQTANSRDGSSMDVMPYFASEDDLHLVSPDYVAHAQYNPDVIDDIDDTIREQIPAPTIGAHELKLKTHDMIVLNVEEPVMPINITTPNNIEGDTMLIKATFSNNGNSTETGVYWYAYLEGYENVIYSPERQLGTFLSKQKKSDSVMMPTILGVIDTQWLHVVVVTAIDNDITNNDYRTPVYLAPAFDLEVVRMSAPEGCALQHSQIGITVRNVGFKDIPTGAEFEIGYHTQPYYPTVQINNLEQNKLNLSTRTDTVRETHSFETPLPRNTTREFLFDSLANLYPTDTAINIKYRIDGWCNYLYDVTKTNDTSAKAASSSPQVNSWYTPDPPFGHDTTFYYGTWGEVTAEQHSAHAPANLGGLKILWHRDSTAASFYTGNNYTLSRKWSTTPQYFHDSTYYLQCFSDKQCPSYFSEVHVHVANRVPVDVGMDGRIDAPLGNRVYMSDDTVRILVTNFGTQPQTNIPVVYQIRRGNNTNPIQTVYDTIRATIAPDQTYAFKFDTLIHFTSAIQSGNYQLRTWTDLPGDTIKRNDTIRWVEKLRPTQPNNTLLDYPFTALGDTYSPGNNSTDLSDDGLDFIRLSYNEIDIDLPPLGRRFTNFGAYVPNNFGNFLEPDQILHVRRGMVDTLILSIVNPSDLNERIRGRVAAYIDYNRSGDFEDDPDETVLPSTALSTSEMLSAGIRISNKASLGYMKMRVVVTGYEYTPNSLLRVGETDKLPGHIVDFLLYVEPDPPATDLAITQIVEPRDNVIRNGDSIKVSFRLFNKGTQPLTSASIYYSYINDDPDSSFTDTLEWHGVLPAGTGTIVTLPTQYVCVGTTRLTIWHELPGDTILTNNQLFHEYHKLHTITLVMNDNFDSLNFWYAPTGYNHFTENKWQLGTPLKEHISAAFSEPNAWVTDTLSIVTSGKRGNVSYLYSPIINIQQIRPDTLSFRLLRRLAANSSLRLEFYNYENEWENLTHDSILSNWYNNVEDLCFDGNSTGDAYNRYWCRTSFVSGDFQEKLQFRFVYSAKMGSNDNASFDEGCAVDDFRIGRAQRAYDLGVIDITKPEQPKYGQTIYPEVVVKNYGFDTVRSIQVGYTHYGTNLARISTFSRVLPPGAIDTFVCTSPFVVTSDFPDTFYINAFTILAADIYWDNDTNSRPFYLAPLDNDICAEEIIAPLDRVIAGDSTIAVTLRFRNFGLNTIDNANLSYIVNGETRVDESVDFIAALGRPLQSTEAFNYTFNTHFRAAMGMMNIVGIVKCDSNEYIYNDTVSKRILGISSITDVAAASIIVDTTLTDSVRFGIIIENRGARGANGFEVGFWVDNDTSTLVREMYGNEVPLAALNTGYYLFEAKYARRNAPWNYVTAYVHIDDDNDPSNDTTTNIVPLFVDIAALELVVEENAGPDCRAFIRVRNIGNHSLFNRTLRLKGTINGNELSYTGQVRIEPMQTILYEFTRTIPKDPQRHYEGSGYLVLGGDTNANNQTSVVRVINYVENVPEVGAGQLVLDQNYPNPFSHQTTIPFSLPNDAHVHFFIMDALGHIVNSFDGFYRAGSNSLTIEMDRYSSGVYYYGIEVDGVRQMRKMVLR